MNGLTDKEITINREKYGTNVINIGKRNSFLKLFLESLGDPIIKILLIALIATLLVTAVPIGGGTISETLIITMLGFPIGALPILTIIATIIDAPATVLNVVGDLSSSMITSKIVNKNKKNSKLKT